MGPGGVDAGEDNAHPEWPDAPVLGVDLDLVAQRAHEALYVGGLVVEELVALAEDPALVDEDPCVGAEAGDGDAHVLVDLEYLPERAGVLKVALRGLVGRKDHALQRVDAHDGCPTLHELQGVLDLVEAPLGREYGYGGVVLVSPHQLCDLP